LLAAAAASPLFAQNAPPPAPYAIAIRAQPIDSFQPGDPGRRVFGALEFRGGLELSSPAKHFGGLSAIRLDAGGENFLAATDRGDWLRGRILYRDGRPSGVANAEMAPMLDADGAALAARGLYDSEALAVDGGTAYVAFERVHQILRFDYGRDGLLARGRAIPVPQDFAKLPRNRGIECLLAFPQKAPFAGGLLAISERALDAGGNLRGFLIGGAKPGEFSIRRHDDFNISDCALMPSGDLLLLERYFSWHRGIAMRIRRVPLPTPGALLDGALLIDADMGYQIDNMEGLSVHRGQDGALILTLVSDDNFLAFQRTLLLQFALREE